MAYSRKRYLFSLLKTTSFAETDEGILTQFAKDSARILADSDRLDITQDVLEIFPNDYCFGVPPRGSLNERTLDFTPNNFPEVQEAYQEFRQHQSDCRDDCLRDLEF